MLETMSVSQIVHWYRRAVGDDWYSIEMPIDPWNFRIICNAHVKQMFALKMGDLQIPAERMTGIIKIIEERKIVWGIYGKSNDRVEFIYLEPPVQRKRLRALSEREGWNIFAKCAGCDGDKWLPVDSYGKPHVACYTCLPPSQYPACGVTASKQSLIRRYVADELGIPLKEKLCPSNTSASLKNAKIAKPINSGDSKGIVTPDSALVAGRIK